MQNQTGKATYPWFKIWIKPRSSLRELLTRCPKRFNILLVLIYGILSAFLFHQVLIALYPATAAFAHPLAYFAALFIGVFLGLFYLYVNSWLYQIVGSWIGGKGTFTDLKCAIAWAGYLATYPVVIRIISLFFSHSPVYFGLLNFLYIVAGIWSFLFMFKLIAEAHQFSFWKALLTFIIIFAFVFIIMMLVNLIIPLVSPIFQ